VRHSQGMRPGSLFAAVIHRPDRPDADPLQTPRLALRGDVEPLTAGPGLEVAARAFLARFPTAAQTLALPDFALYRLEIRSGRLVGGFGRAVDLTAADLRELANT